MRHLRFILFVLLIVTRTSIASDLEKRLDELNSELDRINSQLSDLQTLSKKSRTLEKIKVWGSLGFGCETLYEFRAPLDVTNRFHLRGQNIGGGISFHYEPNRSIVFNAGLGVSSYLNGYNNSSIGMNATDYYLNTFLKTGFGEFNIFLGGPWWIGSSSLTFAAPGYQYKLSPFDRNSWDGIWSDYAWVAGTGVRNGDERAEGARGIKGVRIEGYNLPWNLWGTFFIGKQDGSGAATMNYIHYGRIDRDIFGKSTKLGLAYSTLLDNWDNYEKLSKINNNYATYLKGILFNYIRYYLEAGLSYVDIDREYNKNLQKDLNFKPESGWAVISGFSASFSKFLFIKNLAFNIQPYYIPPEYIGDLSGVVITYRKKVSAETNIIETSNPNPEEVTLFNNRYGGSIKISFSILDFNMQALGSLTKTIKATGPTVGLNHSLDHNQWNLIFEQIGHWYSTEGMSELYWEETDQTRATKANLFTYYQGAGENMYLLDTKWRQRYFSMFSFNAGYDLSKNIRFLNKTYIAYAFFVKSIDNSLNLTPFEFELKNLVWGRMHDLFFATSLSRKLNMIAYAAMEDWKTEQTNPLIDQKELSWGIGFDYIYASNLGIFIRFKHFIHKDNYRPLNDFEGIWANASVQTYF